MTVLRTCLRIWLRRTKKLGAARCTCVFKPYTRIRILRDQYSYLQNDVLFILS